MAAQFVQYDDTHVVNLYLVQAVTWAANQTTVHFPNATDNLTFADPTKSVFNKILGIMSSQLQDVRQ